MMFVCLRSIRQLFTSVKPACQEGKRDREERGRRGRDGERVRERRVRGGGEREMERGREMNMRKVGKRVRQ